MLRKKTKGAKPSVKENSRFFILTAGDNSAEGTTGHLKNTMRRVGNLGRNNVTVGEKKNIQALAAAALYHKAGFESVLEAVKEYRLALSAGTVPLAPKNAFDDKSCGVWLFAHMDS